MRRHRRLIVVGLAACVLALYWHGAAAGAEDERSRAIQAIVGFEEAYTDNVRWAEDGPDKQDAFITTVDGRVDWRNAHVHWLPDRISGGVKGRIFEGFSERDFAQLHTELQHEVGRTGLVLEYRYVPERLELEDDPDAGEVTSAQYELVFGLERRFFEKKLRVRADFEGEWERSLDSFDDRDSFSPAGVLDVRWHVHRMFVPRVLMRYGVREARSENYDRDELDFGAGFDLYPTRPLRLTFRYRRLNRDYTTDAFDGTSSSSNYDREDDADQFEAGLDWALPRWDQWRVQARYKFRGNTSTRDNRDFEVQEGGVGLTYTFR